ncbi:uncharacterized protein DDB_G0271670-like isoform X2 [Sycon ciliatum]|uniref:uncharacterized protein DDB_G0271670-like isoform X2 n=1 Tax=Sycon ciliatum TaxID=27933 RepID=UPI0031F6D557
MLPVPQSVLLAVIAVAQAGIISALGQERAYLPGNGPLQDYAEVGDRVESPLCNSNHPQLTYRRVAMVPMPAKAGSLAPAYVVQHQPPVAGYLYSFQVIMPAFDGVMAAFACSIGVAQPQRQDFYVIMHKDLAPTVSMVSAAPTPTTSPTSTSSKMTIDNDVATSINQVRTRFRANYSTASSGVNPNPTIGYSTTSSSSGVNTNPTIGFSTTSSSSGVNTNPTIGYSTTSSSSGVNPNPTIGYSTTSSSSGVNPNPTTGYSTTSSSSGVNTNPTIGFSTTSSSSGVNTNPTIGYSTTSSSSGVNTNPTIGFSTTSSSSGVNTNPTIGYSTTSSSSGVNTNPTIGYSTTSSSSGVNPNPTIGYSTTSSSSGVNTNPTIGFSTTSSSSGVNTNPTIGYSTTSSSSGVNPNPTTGYSTTSSSSGVNPNPTTGVNIAPAENSNNCEENPYLCSHNSYCARRGATFLCICRSGYTGTGIRSTGGCHAVSEDTTLATGCVDEVNCNRSVARQTSSAYAYVCIMTVVFGKALIHTLH